MLECFDLLREELERIQQGLHSDFQTERAIRDKLYLACKSVKETHFAQWQPNMDYAKACDGIRTSIALRMNEEPTTAY
jgi:hypothetical protein